MEGALAGQGCKLPQDLKEQLEGVISAHVASAVAQCAAIFEARTEKVRWEERRRANGDHLPDWEVQDSLVWDRGFFDSKVQGSSHPSTPAHSAMDGKVASGKQNLDVIAQTPFGDVDCLKVLTNAYSIKGQLHGALMEGYEEEALQQVVQRSGGCNPDEIVAMTQKMMEKLQVTGNPLRELEEAGAEASTGSWRRRPSKVAPLPAGQGQLSRSGSKMAPPPPGQRRSEDEAAPEPGQDSLGSLPPPPALGQSLDTILSPRGAPPSSDGKPSRDDKVREIRQHMAQTLEQTRWLESLTADLETAQIISPSSERRELRKSSTVR